MYHFLAKIGKKKWAPLVVPSIIATVTFGKLGIDYICPGDLVQIYAAKSPRGSMETCKDDLKRIIKSVMNDLPESLNLSDQSENKKSSDKTTTVRWFITSAMEPVVLGNQDSQDGFYVGLPAYMNYTKEDDIPEFTGVKAINLFKWNKPKRSSSSDDPLVEYESTVAINKAISETFLLSEDAKKYAVARSLHIGTSYRDTYANGLLLVSSLLAHSLGRTIVLKWNLMPKHLSFRVPIYVISGIIGLANYVTLTRLTSEKVNLTVDEQTVNLGEGYKNGALEYNDKCEKRRIALGKLQELQ